MTLNEIKERVIMGLELMTIRPDYFILLTYWMDGESQLWDESVIADIPIIHVNDFLGSHITDGYDCPFLPAWKESIDYSATETDKFRNGYDNSQIIKI